MKASLNSIKNCIYYSFAPTDQRPSLHQNLQAELNLTAQLKILASTFDKKTPYKCTFYLDSCTQRYKMPERNCRREYWKKKINKHKVYIFNMNGFKLPWVFKFNSSLAAVPILVTEWTLSFYHDMPQCEHFLEEPQPQISHAAGWCVLTYDATGGKVLTCSTKSGLLDNA